MKRLRSCILTLTVLGMTAGVAQASWYDDYDAGLVAVRKGNWSLAVQKMTAAINGNPKEGNRVRTYGTIMINYHPYYYRGVANMNLGRYDDAIADFEKTSGPGPENLGSLDQLMSMAKKQAAAGSEPEPAKPAPAPAIAQQPSAPAPSPAAPQIDPALRQRASAAIADAKRKVQEAQQRRATSSPQYAQAMSMLTDATTRNAGARTNDDLSGVISIAENAGTLAELAMPASAPGPATAPATATRPAVATNAVLGDYQRQTRRALEYYFNGDFAEATQEFQVLSRQMPRNGWIWAFLGASQYSQYAFEADESYRRAALESFRKAKALRSWGSGLPTKYFSRRIRKAFSEAG